jgi:ribosome-binding protein aMBF1 (putative translation factor)
MLTAVFVTSKRTPKDFDCCWEPADVNLDLLPLALSGYVHNRRAAQQAQYMGDIFPADSPTGAMEMGFLDYFQRDKRTGDAKGIIAINLWRRANALITNERQYRITKAAIRNFEQRMAQNDAQGTQHNPRLHQLMQESIASELEILQAQVGEYEAFRSGRVTEVMIDSLQDLPDVLIRARIAAGLTQKGLATLLGLKEQQLQRYEATGYETVSFARLIEIALALGVQVHIQATLAGANALQGPETASLPGAILQPVDVAAV